MTVHPMYSTIGRLKAKGYSRWQIAEILEEVYPDMTLQRIVQACASAFLVAA